MRTAWISSGDLATRLPVAGPTEVHELAASFNTMARSIESGRRALEHQNEELRQSERLKSELVSIVSHELRTPLASILGFAQLLLTRGDELPPAERRRFLEIVVTTRRQTLVLVSS